MRRTGPLAGVLGLLAILVLSVVPAAPATAHDATTTAFAEVSGSGQDVRAVLELEYDLLMKSAWLYAEAYEATDRPEQRRQLEANADAVTGYALDRFQVAYDDVRCAGSPPGVPDVKERNGRAFAVVVLDFECDGRPGGSHELFSALFPDAENFVHSTKTLVRYDLDGVEGSVVLGARRSQHEVTDVGAAATVTPDERSVLRNLGGFLVLGAEHLVLGLDHLLFLAALMIGSRGLRDVVRTATAFTVAHSVTFLLAALGLVSVPAGIVEPLIPLSIAVVALLELLARRTERPVARWRLPVVFGFGLLHGLGFAGALGIEESWSWELLGSLLAFNVGLEIAQLALVCLIFPLVTVARRTRPGGPLLATTSLLIAAVGLVWFVDRLPFEAELAAVTGERSAEATIGE